MANGYRGFWRLNRQKNKTSRQRRQRVTSQLAHEPLEGKRLLAVTSSFAAGELLFVDDGTGTTANTVSLFMGNATGSEVSYAINTGTLTTVSGVTKIRFQDDAADAGDTLKLVSYGGAPIAINGTAMLFGGVLPITTSHIENFEVDGGVLRAAVSLDDKSVTDDVTVRNASMTVIGASGTTPLFAVGGNLTIESLSVTLPGQIEAGQDIVIESYDSSTLAGQITSRNGSVTIESLIGDLDLSDNAFLITTLDGAAGDVTLRSHCGTVVVEQVCAAGDVVIDGELGAVVERIVDGFTVTIDAECGFASVAQLCIEQDISIRAGLDITLGNVISSEAGDITVETVNGSVRFAGASMLHAVAGSIDVTATRDVVGLGGSVTAVTVLSGGAFYQYANVTIAPPASGSGRAARASAVITEVVINDTTGVVSGGVITAIVVNDPGYGYAPGEEIEVTIDGSPARTATIVVQSTEIEIEVPAASGAQAFATAAVTGSIIAGQAVNVSAGFEMSLGLPIAGDTVTLTSRSGAIEIDQVNADNAVSIDASQGVTVGTEVRSAGGDVAIAAAAGPVDIVDLYAGEDINVTAAQAISITGLLQADTGDISLTSTSDAIAVTNAGKVHSVSGKVDLVATRGAAILQDLFSNEDLTVTSLGDVTLNGVIQSSSANVTVTSDGSINNGARVFAGKTIALTADLSVTSLGGGIVNLQVLSGGANYDYAIVTIAPPAAGGGRQALARATISDGSVVGLTIIDPGYGYAPNERVTVTIEGNPEQRNEVGVITRPAAAGASAAAFAGSALSSLSAGDGVNISAGTEVDITNEVRAKTGAVTVNVTAGTLGVSDIFASDDIDLTAAQTITVAGVVRSDAGDVAVDSKGGGIDMRGTILAPGGGAEVAAAGQVVQRGGSVSRDKVFLLSGGRNYTYALVVVDPPPGAGQTALARAVITAYDPLDETRGGYISDIILLDGGWGYPSDSRVNVSIQGDGEGASAIFATDLVSSSLEARDDVSISSGDSITLVSAVRSSAGDVTIANTLGDVSVQSVTAASNATVTSERGTVTLVSVSTGADATLSAFRGITVTDSVNSVTGDISIETTNGDLEFVQAFNFGDNYLVDDAATVLLPRAVIATKEGGISIRSHNGSLVTPYVMNAKEDVTITTFGALELAHDITSTAGDITATSTSGLVRLRSNIAADAGSITIEAQTQLQQEAVSGISRIELLSPGPMLAVPPDVTVTIDGPMNGGDAAHAIAVIERRALGSDQADPSDDDIIAYEYFIGSIAVIDAGRGYAVGEQPRVTITGVAGATARAYGPNVVAMLAAEKNISLTAGENVTLLTPVHSVAGDIVVTSKTGDLDLSADSLILSAKSGGVTLSADHGSATIQRVAGDAGVTVDALYGLKILGSVYSGAGAISLTTLNGSADVRHLNAQNDVTVNSFQTVTLGGEISSAAGGVAATSSSGGLLVQANVVAAEAISIDAQTFVQQSHGTGLERVNVIERGGLIASEPPPVTVAIAPPIAGGVSATAQVRFGQRSLGRNAQSATEVVEFFIESIYITDAGRGYALGEKPLVAIDGMPGAVAEGIGPTNLQYLAAGSGVTISAGNDVTLLYEATTKAGDISITSSTGSLLLGANDVLLQTLAGSVNLNAAGGSVTVDRISSSDDIVIDGETGTTVERQATAGGAITLTAGVGNVAVAGEVTAKTGAIALTSASGGILLAANIHAVQEAVTLSAHGGVSQTSGSGLREIQVLSGGESDGSSIPIVNVTIAAPSAGGVAATGFARLVTFTNATGEVRWKIDAITILNPGRGYALGESPLVEITGVTGAAALGVGPTGYQDVVAQKDVTVTAGETVTLVNTVRSNAGNIAVSTVDGDLELGTTGLFVHAVTGDVTLQAKAGQVTVQRLQADDGGITIVGAEGVASLTSVNAKNDINLSATIGAVQINGEAISTGGDIAVTSTSSDVRLAANVHAAAGDVFISAHNGVSQASDSGLRSIEVLFGGESGNSFVPNVFIGIAAPVAGGEAAQGYAVLESFRNMNGELRYRISEIVLTSRGRGYAVNEVPSVAITGVVGAAAIAKGPSGSQSVVADNDVKITAGDDVELANSVRSRVGNIAIATAGGNIASTGAIQTNGGGISLAADQGSVSVDIVNAGDDVVIVAENSLTVQRQVTSTSGDISLTSDAGTVLLSGSLGSLSGAIDIKASQGVIQTDSSGVVSVSVLTPGAIVGSQPPVVSVNINAPEAGGVAASASAITSQIGTTLFNGDVVPVWGVTEIIVTNPGSGYANGENPLVTVTGVRGVVAVATGPTAYANVFAKNNVTIAGGDDVTLVNIVESSTGDISIITTSGDVDVSAGGFAANAAGDVAIRSQAGAVAVRNILAGQSASISAEKTIRLFEDVSADAGDITVTSRSGTVFLSANLNAEQGAIAVDAHGGITQTASNGLRRIDVIYGGLFIGQVPPAVTVTIAAPAAGGVAATALATVRQIGVQGQDIGTPIFGVTGITIINPGSGYGVDESPTVTVTGIEGVTAVAVGPDGYLNIVAETDVTLTAGDDLTLVNTVSSATGDIAITSINGDLDLGAETLFIHAEAGRVTLEADCGEVTVERVCAQDDVIITGPRGVTIQAEARSDSGSVTVSAASGPAMIRDVIAEQDVTVSAEGTIDLIGAITAFSGDVAMTSTTSDLDFTAADARIFAADGGVSLTSLAGAILSPPVLNVGGDVALTSFTSLRLNNEVTSATGTITATSTSGGIALGANLVANDDSITLNAKSAVTQLGRGIASVKVLSGGSRYTTATRVTLAAPAAGGITATARPIIGRVNGITGVITGIQIINPGSGYGVGEEVEVTITGAGTGAAAVAYASSELQNISAAKNVTIDAGAGITLLNTVSTLDGDISLKANVGDIDLRTETVKLSAKNGSVDISTFTGAILSPPTLNVTGDISLQSSAALTLTNELTALTGDVTLRSTSGAVSLANNVFAGDRITLDATAGILQTKGFVQAEELVVANKAALPVILGAQENNVDRFAGASVGGITYVDADSFETGVLRGGILGDQRVEVTTNGALTLQAGTSSSGPLRIVGGVSAAPNQLFLSSGSTALPGEVEYVVTNNVSAAPAAFTGSLANMIRLANLNRAKFEDAIVPQTIVFDAGGYAVETITVNAALPAVIQPVTIDGSATESTVTTERVEVTRGATGPLNGLSFGNGSAGSVVTGLSVTGFSGGAAISLLSGGSSVTDTFVGVKRDGATKAANLVGIDISGKAATANTVGGASGGDANVIGGNTIGVRVRGGATGNVITGNFIGTDADAAALGNTKAGVQVVRSAGTLIEGNTIANNADGIHLNEAVATATTSNRIVANTILGNASAGIRLSASSFAAVGDEGAGNTIGKNAIGIVVTKASTSNTIVSNFIGTDSDGDDIGNTSDGVQVVASIGNTIGGLTREAGNTVMNNGGSGIVIRNSVARSTAAGNKVFANFSADNGGHGILVEGAAFHTIGSGADTGNTVVMNAGDGIRVQAFGRTASTQNLVRGNLVGTDSRIADIDLGNAGDGIVIIGGSQNRIDLDNVVRFNAGNGVRIEGSSSNFVGSDVVDEGNQIRDNRNNGLVITGGATNLLASDNIVAGNVIDRNGTSPGTTTNGTGVLVTGSRTVNTAIGTRHVNGRLVGRGNEISDNEGFGVSVVGGASNVQIQGNAIAENVLGSVHIAANANANVATPVITSATLQRLRGTAAQLVVTGTVSGPLAQQLAIDLYSTPAAAITPGMPDYGRKHLGRLTVTITNVTGTAFTATIALQEAAATGDMITATATTMSAVSGTGMIATPIGSTSRFSSPRMLVLATSVSSTSPTRQTRRV